MNSISIFESLLKSELSIQTIQMFKGWLLTNFSYISIIISMFILHIYAIYTLYCIIFEIWHYQICFIQRKRLSSDWITLKFVTKCLFGNNLALVQVIVLCQKDDRLLAKPVITRSTDAGLRHQASVRRVCFYLSLKYKSHLRDIFNNTSTVTQAFEHDDP